MIWMTDDDIAKRIDELLLEQHVANPNHEVMEMHISEPLWMRMKVFPGMTERIPYSGKYMGVYRGIEVYVDDSLRPTQVVFQMDYSPDNHGN